MTPVSHGKPCAGNPHARFEEGASAPETPRRNALLHTFAKPQPWRWDDGSLLENYNTQQHWLRPNGALYLAYTRKGAHNDHVFRHRAPIFMAKFDPVRKCLIRSTEVVLVPELGARLGNFNVIEPASDEAWLITAEWMQSWKGFRCEDFGSDNSLWLARVKFLPSETEKGRVD